MRRSEVDDYYDSWINGVIRVFSLHTEFLPTDYLAIKKEIDGLIIEQNTSRVLLHLDKDILIDLMCKETLKAQPNYGSYMIMVDLKTGNCTCGSWITGPDAHHDSICAKEKFSGWTS